MPQGKFLSGGTGIFLNIVNPADRTQARWLLPHAEFYYCHACTQRIVEGMATWDKYDNIYANGQHLNCLMTVFLKMHHGKTSITVFVVETNWREQQPFEVQVKLPWLKIPDPPHGQVISQRSTGALATSPSMQAQATIPAIFAVAGTSSRSVSTNSPKPPRVATMPRSRSNQEEGDLQDDNDDISWSRKQPAKRRKR